MGVDITGGRLPFVAFLSSHDQQHADVHAKYDQLYNQRDKLPYKARPASSPFDKGWEIHFDADEDFDDILCGPKFTKDQFVVWLCVLDGHNDEYCLVSETKADLKEFIKDFKLNNCPVEKNFKVTQCL